MGISDLALGIDIYHKAVGQVPDLPSAAGADPGRSTTGA
jgi:hypothetical protein